MSSNWIDPVISDNSDFCDSEVEFQLYSQIHYKDNLLLNKPEAHSICLNASSSPKSQSPSPALPAESNLNVIERSERRRKTSECSDVIEDWELLKSDSNSDCSDASKNDDLWAISLQDQHRSDIRIMRYYHKPEPMLRCRICNRTGHKAHQCRKLDVHGVCHLCGNAQHANKQCRVSKLLGHCYNHKINCFRCGQAGHSKSHCPDVWRQFHLTTKPGKLITKPGKLTKLRFCHNCGGANHFAHECTFGRNKYNRIAASPTVFQFDKFYKKFKTKSKSSKQNHLDGKIDLSVRSTKIQTDSNLDYAGSESESFPSLNPNWLSFQKQTNNSLKRKASAIKSVAKKTKFNHDDAIGKVDKPFTNKDVSKPKNGKTKFTKKSPSIKAKSSKPKANKNVQVFGGASNLTFENDVFPNGFNTTAGFSWFTATSEKLNKKFQPSVFKNNFLKNSKKLFFPSENSCQLEKMCCEKNTNSTVGATKECDNKAGPSSSKKLSAKNSLIKKSKKKLKLLNKKKQATIKSTSEKQNQFSSESNFDAPDRRRVIFTQSGGETSKKKKKFFKRNISRTTNCSSNS